MPCSSSQAIRNGDRRKDGILGSPKQRPVRTRWQLQPRASSGIAVPCCRHTSRALQQMVGHKYCHSALRGQLVKGPSKAHHQSMSCEASAGEVLAAEPGEACHP